MPLPQQARGQQCHCPQPASQAVDQLLSVNQQDIGTHLHWRGIWCRLVEEHEQLARADAEVWCAELVGHVPTQRPKLEALLRPGNMHTQQAHIQLTASNAPSGGWVAELQHITDKSGSLCLLNHVDQLTDLHRGVEEAQPKQQLLELAGALAAPEEGWVTDGVGQVAAEQVLPAGAGSGAHTRQHRRCLSATAPPTGTGMMTGRPS